MGESSGPTPVQSTPGFFGGCITGILLMPGQPAAEARGFLRCGRVELGLVAPAAPSMRAMPRPAPRVPHGLCAK